MRMALDRVTWFGLGLAILGWVVLVADAAIGPVGLPGGMVATAVLRSDIFSIAETTIVSGFAIAILGVLRAGFGALHAFFDAVLERADAPPRPAAGAHPSEPVLHPEPLGSTGPVMDLHPAARTAPGSGTPGPRPGAAKPTKRKNYTILDNGAVEVDTLLGTRVFASLDEARDYIR